MFSCVICMDVASHLIFFDIYGLFFRCFCMEYLVDLLVLDLRFRNRRDKIYRNVKFSLKYMVHHIF
jgi:hypothetical protein